MYNVVCDNMIKASLSLTLKDAVVLYDSDYTPVSFDCQEFFENFLNPLDNRVFRLYNTLK